MLPEKPAARGSLRLRHAAVAGLGVGHADAIALDRHRGAGARAQGEAGPAERVAGRVERDRQPPAVGIGRALQALAGQEHALAHAQLERAVVGGGEADDRGRLRRARTPIGVLPARRGQACGDQAERREGRGAGEACHAPWVVACWRAVAVFETRVRPKRAPKRKNHGRARRASELAWREVLATVPRERVELARLQNAWPRLVPRHLQEVAWPAGLSGGRLYVHVTDNQWLHELSYLREDLLAKLRRACPTAALRELRLRVGEVELTPSPVPVRDPVVPGLPREPERATIEAMEAIDDPALRNAVAAARLALGSR
jgi:hypothetical protein